MKTFEFTVENLGPIKNASFSSSHLNVICGKNNSGKSFLIHAIYCIFYCLNDMLRIKPKAELVDAVLTKGCAKFPIEDYFSDLNEHIANAMPHVIELLPRFMNKSTTAFKDCKINVSINKQYAKDFLINLSIDFNFIPVKNLKVTLTKEENEGNCQFILENGAETLPSRQHVYMILSFALSRLIGRVLPSPVLLTAERAGVSMFTSDVMAHALSVNSDGATYGIESVATEALREHYPIAILQEMLLQKDIKQTKGGQPYRLNITPSTKAFYDWFASNVMDGDVVAREGKLYFTQYSNKLEMPFSDVSSSVRALTELNFFVHYLMAHGALLMIDEPELNLHPERQRMLSRALARMVNNFGVGVVLSTHSITMVREFNTLLAFKTLEDKALPLMETYGYEEDEILDENDVSYGIVEDGTIYQDKQSLQKKGLLVRSFDDTNENIAMVQSAIVNLWD